MYLLLVLLTVATHQASAFNNPILGDTDYFYPGVIKVNGSYYVVSQSYDTTKGIIPIYTSNDLIQWNPAGYVFAETSAPAWTNNVTITTPEIQKIGNNYLFYFSAYNSSNALDSIGAAIASHPRGPYTAIDQPILYVPNKYAFYPSIINDEGKLYLLWWERRGDDNTINLRELNSDGLSFASNQTSTLLQPSLTWEGGLVYSPWYIHRGNYHYLFYAGHSACESASIGVARSSNALGPYEKLPYPIIVPNSEYKCTRDASVVKGLDDEGDVIFFNAIRRDDEYQDITVLLAYVYWDSDDWPFVDHF